MNTKIKHTATKKQKPLSNNDESLKLNRIGRLRNSKEIGKFVSRILHLAAKHQKSGADVTNNCYKLTVMASMLNKIVEGDELKARVKELEEILIKKEHEISQTKTEPT